MKVSEKMVAAAQEMCRKRGVKREYDVEDGDGLVVSGGFEWPPARIVVREIVEAALAAAEPGEGPTREELAIKLHAEHVRREGIDPIPWERWSSGMREIWLGHADTCLAVFAQARHAEPAKPAGLPRDARLPEGWAEREWMRRAEAAEKRVAELEAELLAVAEALDMVNRPEGQGGYQRASGERMAAEVLRLKCIELQTVPALEAELAKLRVACTWRGSIERLCEDLRSDQPEPHPQVAVYMERIKAALADHAKPAVDGAVRRAFEYPHGPFLVDVRTGSVHLPGHDHTPPVPASHELLEARLRRAEDAVRYLLSDSYRHREALAEFEGKGG